MAENTVKEATEPGAPADRFCDLVMKGGITSGVVYPPAICALAQAYRFKNIGGTSAGAIAAAVTAAAEYRRRHTGSLEGFELLSKLPELLGTPDERGETRLLRLFQPDPPCRRLFGILIGSLNAGGTFRRIGAVLLGCMKAYWMAALASVVLTILTYLGSHSILAAVLLLLLTLPLLVALAVYLDFTRSVVANNYGLCKGLTTRPESGEALTPWLHQLIQHAAGLPLDQPLTFGHLWTAPGFPPPDLPMSEEERKAVRSIDLQMFTTNLSHGRPYIFPHLEPTARLFFKPAELAAYLPPEVSAWLDAKGIPYAPNPRSPKSDPEVSEAQDLTLKEIPPADQFPIVLATRMSLSFPVLFSAVPFWAIDYEDPRGSRHFQPCLFSDGGISSNFPMHLFDGLLPSWPTFGIELEPALPSLPKSLIFLPHAYNEGIADRWTRFNQKKRAASRMGGFLMSIVDAMQNWNDNTLSRMPGVRDRVVRLRLKNQEGGLNLNMDPDLINAIALRGKDAAGALLHRFDPTRTGWDDQRWVRLDVLMRTLADKSGGLYRSLGNGVPHATSYADLLSRASAQAPPGHARPLTPDQSKALQELVTALQRAADSFGIHAPQYENTQIPNPDLRVRPSL